MKQCIECGNETRNDKSSLCQKHFDEKVEDFKNFAVKMIGNSNEH